MTRNIFHCNAVFQNLACLQRGRHLSKGEMLNAVDGKLTATIAIERIRLLERNLVGIFGIYYIAIDIEGALDAVLFHYGYESAVMNGTVIVA